MTKTKLTWTPKLESELRRVYAHKTAREISSMKMFKGFSINSIQKKASRMGITTPTTTSKPVAKKRSNVVAKRSNPIWTPERKNFLKKHYSTMTVEQILKNRMFKGLTYKAVTNQAWRLHVTR